MDIWPSKTGFTPAPNLTSFGIAIARNLVVTGTPGFVADDIHLLRTARRAEILDCDGDVVVGQPDEQRVHRRPARSFAGVERLDGRRGGAVPRFSTRADSSGAARRSSITITDCASGSIALHGGGGMALAIKRAC